MLTATIVLFAIAAVGGLTLAIIRFRGTPIPPMGLALVHGAVAATALVLLLILALGASGTSTQRIALGGFVVAALGGFFIFSFHVRNKPLPIPMIVVHAIVAVASFVTLLAAAMGR
ncbi:MAG: hypothetical protein M3Q69_18500 [Acidobacteriota bacterium]|nr:hypothetical protein [Acidobacteriota bacterium]